MRAKKNNLWQRLGPGILLAATSVGASHLVLSPQAGALFGFDLLWLVVVSHLFKYPAFEFGPRYAAATGQHLLQGYLQVPGPRGWPLVLFLLTTVLQGIGVLAGVVHVTGAVLHSWTGVLDAELLSLVVIAAVVVFLFAGGFSWLDSINKVMMSILALATVLAFVPVCHQADYTRLVIPAVPAGSIALVAAILGWMPTGIDVSVWHSFWTLEKLDRLGLDPRSQDSGARRRHLKISLADMRTGYGLSLLTGIMFITMGAVHLAGQGDRLQGVQFAEALSSTYTAILGRWMYHVFMLTAFCAMFSTSYTVIDGFSRSFSEALACLKSSCAEPRVTRRLYGGFVLGSAAFAAVALCWVGNPVTLVTAVAIISLAVTPILYGLNIYCVSNHIQDPGLRPPRVTVALGWAGCALMTGVLVLYLYVKVLA